MKPAALQDLLASDREFKYRNLRKNFTGFVEHTKTRAKHFETYNKSYTPQKDAPDVQERASRRQEAGKKQGNGGGGKGSPGGADSDKTSAEKSAEGGDSAGRSKGTGEHESGSNSGKSNESRSSAGSGSDTDRQNKEPPVCVNKKCDGARHWMGICPKSTAEEKAAFSKEYGKAVAAGEPAEEAAKAEAQSGGLNTLTEATCCDDDSTLGALQDKSAALMVSFGTDEKFAALADTGADHSAVDRKFVKRLQNDEAFIAITKLKTPLSLKLAIDADDDGKVTKPQEFLVTEAARLTPIIDLPRGPLALRNVLHVMTEKPLNRILLGRPELDLMGFNAKNHLDEVRDKFHERDFSKANESLMSAMANTNCKPEIGH